MPGPWRVVSGWCRVHRYATAWLLFRAMWSVEFAVALCSPAGVLRWMAGGRVIPWFAEHTLAGQVVAFLVPLLVLDRVAHLLAPDLTRTAAWPAADQEARLRIEERLYRVPVWKLLGGLLVWIVLLSAGALLGWTMPGPSWVYSVPLLTGIYLVMDLRPTRRPVGNPLRA